MDVLEEAHWLKPPTLAGTIVTICRSPFTTGGSGKEHGTNKSPPNRRVQERSEGDTMCPTASQNPRWHPPWLSDACATRKDSELEWLAKDHLETNPIIIKPKTVTHVAEQFSWVPYPTALHPGALSQ